MDAVREKDDRGETLLTLIIALGVASLLVAVLAFSIFTTLSSTSVTTTQIYESNDAQLVANYFSTDVQALAEITSTDCQLAVDESKVVAIQRGDGAIIGYYENSATATMVRRVCDSLGAVTESNTIARSLAATPPTVQCDGGACVSGLVPDEISLTVTEASGFAYDLVGARRYLAGSGMGSWRFVILGSGSNVVDISGGPSHIDVDGDALVTSTSPSWYSGSSGDLSISGTTTQMVVPDPLAGLPHPTAGSLPVYTDGNYHGPGIYRNNPLSINHSTAMAPGTYILEEGMTVSGNATITGSDVLLFNGCATDSPPTCANSGSLSMSGRASIQLSPPTSGTYSKILYFQHRNNTSSMWMSGTSELTSTSGVIYAPDASSLRLTGTADLTIGAIVTNNIDVRGNASITVGP